MSGVHSCGNRACGEKVVATRAATCSGERALLVHARPREQGVQVGDWVLDAGAGTQEEVWRNSQGGQRGGASAGVRTLAKPINYTNSWN